MKTLTHLLSMTFIVGSMSLAIAGRPEATWKETLSHQHQALKLTVNNSDGITLPGSTNLEREFKDPFATIFAASQDRYVHIIRHFNTFEGYPLPSYHDELKIPKGYQMVVVPYGTHVDSNTPYDQDVFTVDGQFDPNFRSFGSAYYQSRCEMNLIFECFSRAPTLKLLRDDLKKMGFKTEVINH